MRQKKQTQYDMSKRTPTVILATLYCVSGSGLTYANKMISTEGHRINPFLALFLQNAVTVALLLLFEYISPATTGVLKWPSNKGVLKRFLVLVVLFFGMLVSSLCALRYVTVSCLIVERNLVSLLVAILEYILLGTAISRECAFALCGIIVGAVLYGAADIGFSYIGYAWLTTNVVCTSAFQIYNKKMLTDIELSPFQFSYLNNILSLIPCMFGCIASWDTLDIRHTFEPGATLIYLCISTLLGFCLSVSAFALSRAITATTMMVVNNSNKFLLIVIMQIAGSEGVSNISMFGTFVALTYAGIYSYLKRQTTVEVSTRNISMSRSKKIRPFVLFFSVTIILLFSLAILDNGVMASIGVAIIAKNAFTLHLDNTIRSVRKGSNLSEIKLKFDRNNLSEVRTVYNSRVDCKCGEYPVCHFQNLCYSIPKGSFVLYVKPGLTNKTFFNLRSSAHPRGKLVNIKMLSRTEMPTEENITFHNGTYVYVTKYNRHSVGHILFDEVWTAFHAQTMFGVDVGSSTILTDIDNGKLLKLFALISRSRVKDFKSLLNKKTNNICFRSVVTGMVGMGYSWPTLYGLEVNNQDGMNARKISPTVCDPNRWQKIWLFRSHIFKSMKVKDTQLSWDKGINILYLVKTAGVHLRNILNWKSIQIFLKSQHDSYQISSIDWKSVSLRQQIEISKNIHIMVGLPGSALFNTLYMPKGSWLLGGCVSKGHSSFQQYMFSYETLGLLRFRPYLNIVQFCNKYITSVSSVGYNVDKIYVQNVIEQIVNIGNCTRHLHVYDKEEHNYRQSEMSFKLQEFSSKWILDFMQYHAIEGATGVEFLYRLKRVDNTNMANRNFSSNYSDIVISQRNISNVLKTVLKIGVSFLYIRTNAWEFLFFLKIRGLLGIFEHIQFEYDHRESDHLYKYCDIYGALSKTHRIVRGTATSWQRWKRTPVTMFGNSTFPFLEPYIEQLFKLKNIDAQIK